MNYVLTVAVAAACAALALRSRDLARERDGARRVAARAVTKLVVLRIAAEVGEAG